MNIYRDAAQKADQRREHLLREAEYERLARVAQTGQRQAGDRLLSAVGNWMIASGKRLKERGESQVPHANYSVLQEINT
ncbi:MAG: hypothetical protein R3E39_08345 [Anaerolineae bacterium]